MMHESHKNLVLVDEHLYGSRKVPPWMQHKMPRWEARRQGCFEYKSCWTAREGALFLNGSLQLDLMRVRSRANARGYDDIANTNQTDHQSKLTCVAFESVETGSMARPNFAALYRICGSGARPNQILSFVPQAGAWLD